MFVVPAFSKAILHEAAARSCMQATYAAGWGTETDLFDVVATRLQQNAAGNVELSRFRLLRKVRSIFILIISLCLNLQSSIGSNSLCLSYPSIHPYHALRG
jgi:hypothetical protein